MSQKPWWKGSLVDREYLKELLEGGFRKCATGDFDTALGKLTSRIERYVALQVLHHSKMMIEEIQRSLEEATKTLSELHTAAGRDHIRDMAQLKEEEDDD